jgi:hypothetical protein
MQEANARKLPWRNADDSGDDDDTEGLLTGNGWYYTRSSIVTATPPPEEEGAATNNNSKGQPLAFEDVFPRLTPTQLAAVRAAKSIFHVEEEEGSDDEPVHLAPVAKRPRVAAAPVAKRPRGRPPKVNTPNTTGRGGGRGRAPGRGGRGLSLRARSTVVNVPAMLPTDDYTPMTTHAVAASRPATSRPVGNPYTHTAAVASRPVAVLRCSHCFATGHNDRDCKENVLLQLERQRQEREAARNSRYPMMELDDDMRVCVDITQDEGEGGAEQSFPDISEDEAIRALESLDGRV